MNKLLIFLFSSLLILGTGCDKDSNDFPLLTVIVQENAVANGQEKWVIITDTQDNELAQGACANGQQFTLMGEEAPEQINVSVFSYDKAGQFGSYYGTVLNVQTGETIYIRSSQSLPQFESIGSATVEISNYTDPGDPRQNLFFINGIDNPNFHLNSLEKSGTTVTASVKLYTELKEILITSIRENKRVYHNITDLSPGDHLEIDWNVFKEFEHYTEVPEAFTDIKYTVGYRDEYSYTLAFVSPPLPGSSTPIGYIDGYESYLTGLFGHVDATSVSYFKRGEMVEQLELPAFTREVINSNIESFDFTTSIDYTYKSNQWLYSPPGGGSGLSWGMVGDKASELTVHRIPGKVQERFKDLKLEDLNLFDFSLTQRLDGYTYEDLVEDRFGPEDSEPAEYEYFTYY